MSFLTLFKGLRKSTFKLLLWSNMQLVTVRTRDYGLTDITLFMCATACTLYTLTQHDSLTQRVEPLSRVTIFRDTVSLSPGEYKRYNKMSVFRWIQIEGWVFVAVVNFAGFKTGSVPLSEKHRGTVSCWVLVWMYVDFGVVFSIMVRIWTGRLDWIPIPSLSVQVAPQPS